MKMMLSDMEIMESNFQIDNKLVIASKQTLSGYIA